jgi:malate synthase
VSLRYIASWLSGNGCVPIFNLMEDAATAEIARAQLWQWIHHGAATTDGLAISAERFRAVLLEEQALLRRELGDSAYSNGHYSQAAIMIDELTTAPTFVSFLTTPGYAKLAEPPAST